MATRIIHDQAVAKRSGRTREVDVQKNRMVLGGLLLCLITVSVAAAPPQGWRRLLNDLLGEGSAHLGLVRGTVRFDGASIAGGNFTATRTGTGTYFVAYDDVFADTPTVIVQIVGTDLGPNGPVTYVESETLVGFVVETKVGGVLADRSFKFHSIGPR